MFDKEFWNLCFIKVIETLLSVKVWVIFSFLAISTYLCIHGFVESGHWATSNASIISVVFALREGFKTAKVKNNTELEKMKNGDPKRNRELDHSKRTIFKIFT